MTSPTEATPVRSNRLPGSSVIVELVFEEIERLVADAIREQSCLSTAICADRIFQAYPGFGFSERELANEIMMFAARAGVPVEFGRQASLKGARSRAAKGSQCDSSGSVTALISARSICA
jgi:hypothetical protein